MTDPTSQHLDLATYYEHFQADFWQPHTRFWKLERGQHYAEPGDASWTAFNHGNWNEALTLLEEERDRLTEYHDRCKRLGITTARVRIVETPITPYLQWELHLLHLRAQTGGDIRILPAEAITILERHGPLPDLNIPSPHNLYTVTYDNHGVLHHATKTPWHTAADAICSLIETLYRDAEPIATYFPREIAHLPAPAPDRPLPDNYLETTGRPHPIKS